ncbi:MAG: DNA polymerase III subunit beta, partial [Faecalibacterium prausnitzii]|nr:DNA polymerase III subunit beta [Faecalibacterium prausnitzii]
MNIICDKTLLSAAIDGVSKAVTMRSAIPVLEGILLKAEGFQLTLTG